MGLYVVYIINVKDNAAFTHFETLPDYMIAMIAISAVFGAIYLIWYVILLFMHLLYIRKLPIRSRWLLFYSLIMVIMCVCTFVFGVYSPYYYNGGLFVFFMGAFNIYVWSLLYLNWPTNYQQLVNQEDQVDFDLKFERNV